MAHFVVIRTRHNDIVSAHATLADAQAEVARYAIQNWTPLIGPLPEDGDEATYTYFGYMIDTESYSIYQRPIQGENPPAPQADEVTLTSDEVAAVMGALQLSQPSQISKFMKIPREEVSGLITSAYRKLRD